MKKDEQMKKMMLRLWREEEGQDLTEYALLLVLIALAVAAVLPFFATALNTVFNSASANLQTTT
jgi:pilus assembly protein Flp/PilA